MLKKVLLAVLLIMAATLSLASCDRLGALGGAAEPKIEISDDGYVVVNGKKTEHKVDTEDEIIVDEEGYLVVNGVTTEHKVHTKDEITVDGDGYLVVNGVKTEYAVDYCNHEYETVTTQPTCTEGGYDTKTCKLCGRVVIDNKKDAAGHDLPSYTIDGDYHYSECTRCDYATEKEMHVAGDDNLCTKCKIPLSATAGIVYDLSADGTYAVVIGYEGTDTAVKIADTYKGVPVKEIYSEAFRETSITSMVIPDSVTSIGSSAFSGCYRLTSVVIVDSVTSIGAWAFQYCSSLTSVVIPDSVTSIGSEAFSGCYRLTSVVIGDSVTSIGYKAFYRCSSLTSVVIPDSVTSIGSEAFSGCNSALYTEYEYGRYVGDGENTYAILLEVINKNMSTYTINPTTRIIANDVFSGCERLANITISDSVTSIGSQAFYECASLTSVVIPDSVTCIGYQAFYRCSSLTSVVIGDSVASIGDYAFYYCSNLTSVVIPDSVTSIGSYAFFECTSLTSVVIGDSVTSIGYEAFYNCDSLTSVVIPDSVTSIGDYAFYSDNLTSIKYRGTEEQWNAITKGSGYKPYDCKITYNYTGE